jgi:hypothetical protein
MVNTFLPWPDRKQTAETLDNKRLGKQRVEALQILRANLGLTKGWVNHPAAVMWRGHEGYLYGYTNAMCITWRERGYEDNVQARLQELYQEHDLKGWDEPWWFSNPTFNLSHQSNLLRKDEQYYRMYFPPDVPIDLPYQWPMPDGTFRIVQRKEANNGLRKRRADRGQT